jgi:hypothetical protein
MTRGRFALVAAPPLAVVLAWLVLGWYPQRQERADASERIEVMDAQNADAMMQLAAARKLAEGADTTAAELGTLRARIPDAPDVGGFVLLNQSIALETGFLLTDVTPQADIEERFLPGALALPPTLQPTVVSITGTGSFDAVWAYTRRLTEAERLVVIDSISIDAEEAGVVRCALRIRIFSTREAPADAASGEDDLVAGTVPR